jgi:L-fuconolactonase
MVTEADRERWRPGDIAPYLDVVFEAFGPDRLMIGSDWPVCRQAAGYQHTMGIVETYVADLAPAERDAVLGGTAVAWYGLDV